MNAPVLTDRIKALETGFFAETHKLFIGGQWVDAETEQTIEVINPATGAVFAKVQAGGAGDIDKAVKAARQAFESGPWPAMNGTERAKLLWRLADAIEANADEIGLVESLDNGMPMMMAKFGAALGSANNLRYNAGWAGKVLGETIEGHYPNRHVYTLKQPVGVVGAITPWNFPLPMEVAKIAPALAAGCTVVLKPAELTPLTAIKLAQLIEQCGFPPGVVNIVTGYGDPAGKALVEHPDVDKISFTGSTATGKWIVQAAAGNLKRVSLELGGKSPNLIFPDADLEKAIPGAAMSIFGNAGQVCVAGSRLYVHKDVFDKVVDGVSGMAKSLRVGPGQDPDTQMGPLISQKQLERVSGYIASGKEEGAEVVVGGERAGNQGYFMQPTVLAETNREMRVVREEIFGPVVCAMPINDDDIEKIARTANDTTYGLAAYIWTRDMSVAHKLAKKVQAGTVSINGSAGIDPAVPFGGFKQSGWGRENGFEGAEHFFETKTVSMAL
jgi:acyl-CoA reductase-like NAD-dependent aldehyde dehydrogenase